MTPDVDHIVNIPDEMFGTKTPSITSRCSQSASLWFSISTSRCRLVKSAESSDGEISVSILFIRLIQTSDDVLIVTVLAYFVVVGQLTNEVQCTL